MDEAHWIALRTFTNRSPINLTGLASTAIRIRASDQLNGVVDQLSAIVTSIVPDYDYLTDTWILRATSNPASLYREVLQGAGNARPIADAKVHLEDLKVWHDECRINNREFNQVRDFQSSVWEALSDIAAAGRGSPSFRDGKWTVVVDRPKSTISQHFTPRNSWGFTGDKTFAKMPHGFRIRFVNRDKDWKQDERIVYDDGYDETNATEFEGLELPGVTDPNQIWSDGRTHIAQARLRPERYTLEKSANADLAAIAAKSLKEVRYHLRHSRDWLVRLGDGTDESHARVQASLDQLFPYTQEFWVQSPAEAAAIAAGIGVDVTTLRADWDAMKAAGCEDAEILEVNQVCAYFNYSNRLLNGLGVTTQGDVVGFYKEPDAD